MATKARWYFLTASAVKDTTGEVPEMGIKHFDVEMMASEESSMGVIGTLHRWEELGSSKTRRIWIIVIENGVPVVREAQR